MKVTVTRAFLLDGLRQEPGTSIELADGLARELIQIGKACTAEPVAPPAGPMTTATVPAAVAGRRPSRSTAKKASTQ